MAKKTPYIVIAFSIAGILSVLSYFDAYDYIENLLLDLRFKSRGRMETRSDIATVDIDVPALQKEGKWDPWSREKHIPLIKAAGEHGMDALIFDFYFIEDSERKLEMKALNRSRKLISKINSALQRIKDGTYGYCEETGEPIGLKRLMARPVATLSIEAQERHERDEKIFVDD